MFVCVLKVQLVLFFQRLKVNASSLTLIWTLSQKREGELFYLNTHILWQHAHTHTVSQNSPRTNSRAAQAPAETPKQFFGKSLPQVNKSINQFLLWLFVFLRRFKVTQVFLPMCLNVYVWLHILFSRYST